MSLIKENPALIARLVDAQNHPALDMVDVMTFVGLMDSQAELLAHVERCERRVATYVAPTRRRRTT